MKMYQKLARLIGAINKCEETGNPYLVKHEENLEKLAKNFPTGSGFDDGTILDMNESTSEKLIFKSAYHMMDEDGYYAGWIELTITVTASLMFDYKLNVRGQFSKHKEAYGLKEYIEDVFSTMLDKEV